MTLSATQYRTLEHILGTFLDDVPAGQLQLSDFRIVSFISI
jgi:hypothetical protein